MNIQEIANKILYKKAATKLDLHSIVKKSLRLNKEGGSTRDSLENLHKILVYFEPNKITFHFKSEQNIARLHVEFSAETTTGDDFFLSHDFTGFNAGYGGEGPKGLYEALKAMAKSSPFSADWSMDVISNLKSGVYKIL